MKYLAILGRQPEFGLVELESLLGADNLLPWGRTAALVNSEPDIHALGGVIKVGRILYRGPTRDLNESPLDITTLPRRESKTSFGLSYYGLQASKRFVEVAGINLKKRLRAQGSVRFVAPSAGLNLGAAQVKFNRLIQDGFELLIAINKQEMVIAITTQIQDIDWYAVRDYNRPTRSAKVGMLPPKLAQIMLNTTTLKHVYDPFCGSGVVLQEALLMGRTASGSDASEEMVEATRSNLHWLDTQKDRLPHWDVALADATTVKFDDKKLAIVSEGYLGPNMKSVPSKEQLSKMKPELTRLYLDSLASWAKQLESGAEVTITSPTWQLAAGPTGLNLVDQIADLGYTLKQFTHVKSRALIYRRPNQFVGRELLILRKD